MLLRRVTKHVKDQNWFAVGIDFVIVVIGVFIGLQVQDLYNNSGDRIKEQAYLGRLHAESIQNLGFNRTNFEQILLLENFRQIERSLGEVLESFEERDTDIELTPRHCLAIMTSSIYNDQQSYLPTLSELIASGQLAIIQDNDLKAALSNYTLAFNALKQQVDELNITRTELFQKYHEFVQIDRKMRDITRTDQFSHTCNFDAMKEDNQFNIDLTLNRVKIYYYNLMLAKQQSALARVHAELDRNLGISHQEIEE